MAKKENKRARKLWEKAIKKRTTKPKGTWSEHMKRYENKQKNYEEKWAKDHPNVDAMTYRVPGAMGSGKKK